MNKAEELIACLEREVAKRDARIVGLESQYQRDVYGLNNEGDPIGGDPAGGYANDNARLRAELSALKAQDAVGEVVGWYRLDRPYEMTSYPSVCATWHRLGAPVAPLYAAPVQQVSVPNGWRDGYRAAMNSAASGARQLYVQHCHHHGVNGLLDRCKELEQSFIRDADALLAAAPAAPGAKP